MPTYLHPGVYIEEIPSGSRPIEAVSTSIPIFVGEAKEGPVNQAEFILKWDDYKRLYGGVKSETDAMGLAVSSYYANGGGAAYVARLANGALPSSLPLTGATSFRPNNNVAANPWQNTAVFGVTAKEVGTGGDSITARITGLSGGTFTLTISDGTTTETYAGVTMNERSADFVVTTVNAASSLVTLTYLPGFSELSGADQSATFPQGSVTSGSLAGAFPIAALDAGGLLKINVDGDGVVAVDVPAKTTGNYDGTEIASLIQTAVEADHPGFTAAFASDVLTLTSPTAASYSAVTFLPTPISDALNLTTGSPTVTSGIDNVTPANSPVRTLSGGSDGAAPGSSDYKDFFGTQLVKIKDVSIIVLPGKPLTDANRTIVDAAIAHCEATKSRMTIIDPPVSTELKTAADVTALGAPTKTYGVLYYPWLKVPNPFYDADKNPAAAQTLTIAPSAAAAGMWGKIDGRRGVWKAPAGVNTGLLGVVGAEYEVEDGIQAQLNPLGINAVRRFPRFGHVFWGARTLATNADPEWRYVPIRRTAIMIERSIFEGIQWAVFEPNNHNLWASLRLNIGNFMDGLFRSGAFQGERASDAYFVRCGLGDTMTQGDIDAGRVIAVVGFAPLKPAEFVIVRIQQIVAQR
jgi:phage tail sheath protein FI